jgi:hypothetical protein
MFIIGLPQGCGASVASAAGPFTTLKEWTETFTKSDSKLQTMRETDIGFVPWFGNKSRPVKELMWFCAMPVTLSPSSPASFFPTSYYDERNLVCACSGETYKFSPWSVVKNFGSGSTLGDT